MTEAAGSLINDFLAAHQAYDVAVGIVVKIHAGRQYDHMVVFPQFPDGCFIQTVGAQTVKLVFVLLFFKIISINIPFRIGDKRRKYIVTVMLITLVQIKVLLLNI